MLHPKNSFECNVIWHMFEEHNIMSRTGRWRVKSWNKWKSVSRNFNSHKRKLSEHASLETNKNVYIFTCKNIYGIEKYLSFCKNRNYIFILEANTALTNWSMSKSICMLTKLGIPSNTQRNFLFHHDWGTYICPFLEYTRNVDAPSRLAVFNELLNIYKDVSIMLQIHSCTKVQTSKNDKTELKLQRLAKFILIIFSFANKSGKVINTTFQS